EAQKRIDELTKQLEAMGVDVKSMKADMDEQQKALEMYKERAKQLELIKARFEKLKAKLDELTKLGLAVNVRHNRMVISLPGDVLFDSGKETLKKEGKDLLLKVAGIIKADPQLVSRDYQVAGDTDNQPLAHGPFKDNWGLSLMRAREVLVFLIDPSQGGLPIAHWSAAGFGDSDPVADNATPEGRQKNRRCELIVLPSVEEMLDLKAITQ
ncbi:MAG TPA: OmpA family protein, partial [Polyangiaceae bacterium]|nr:OmpA family protein [Polyangiaceae bacterium]